MAIPLFKVRMAASVDAAVKEVLHSGFIGQGEKGEEFEKGLEGWVGRKGVLSVNSCTSALQLALRLSGVGAGTEVISTPVTCTATNVPVLAAGASLLWGDVDPRTGCLDPLSVKSKITKRTKAVIAVHWGGLPCDLDALREICDEYGLKLIEDAAHAIGATYKGAPIGAHGDFVCFSFQAIKHVTCGDGGLLVCKDPKDYERGKLLRWYGIKRPANLKDDIREWGYKFHMNDIAAAIGNENLKGLADDLKERRRNAHKIASGLGLDTYNSDSAYWFFPYHHKKRDEFVKYMHTKGVMAGPVHERNDHYFMFASSAASLPGVEEFCATQVNLPVGPWLTDKDRKTIVEAVSAFR